MVTHQLQVRCMSEKVRRSETDVLPLSYTTNQASIRHVGRMVGPITASAFNRLFCDYATYASSPGNRTYCYSEVQNSPFLL